MREYLPVGMLTAVLLSLTAPSTSWAWGKNGHRITCEIAWNHLTPEGRTLVEQLQKGEAKGFAETCLWADEVKRTTHVETYRYHFLNVPAASIGYVPERDCPDHDCLPWAVEHYLETLADEAQKPLKRNEALKFLGHFVGDVHTPLHVGRPEDRGGNDVEVCFFDDCGHPRNPLDLHLIWDTKILDHGRERWRVIAERLDAAITRAELEAWQGQTLEEWIHESYRLVEDFVYTKLPRDGIGEEYYREALPIVEQRLQQGGVRLAELINQIAAESSASDEAEE